MIQSHKITNANIKEWAKNYNGEPFDAILCDPPYELGFMGKSWDSSGIAFDTDMWTDLFRHVKPGGHLLAFSGSRTYHRMAVAIEDAGFEIRDMIEWVYGSGFPKSLNIGKVTDKYLKTGNASWNGTGDSSNGALGYSKLQHKQGYRPNDYSNKHQTKSEITEEQAKQFEGYGTALKPAHEPCVLARKPIEGTVANNVLKHGTGGLNIDGSRITHNEPVKTTSRKERSAGWNMENTGFDSTQNTQASANTMGRFPANLILDGSDEVVGLFPDTGKSTASKGHFRKGNVVGDERTSKAAGQFGDGAWVAGSLHNDSGSAARFFYTAKSSRAERNAGLEGFDTKQSVGGGGGIGDYLEDVNSASGKYGSEKAPSANHHPTVKPLSLTKYLANLIKPPTGGRLLVPFSGSGSEMIGALQAGWEYVEGVELTEEYIPIAEARIKYWLEKPSQGKLL